MTRYSRSICPSRPNRVRARPVRSRLLLRYRQRWSPATTILLSCTFPSRRVRMAPPPIHLLQLMQLLPRGMTILALPMRRALINQVLPKLCSPLINTHRMSDHLRRRPGRIRELAPSHPRALKLRHAINRIKQSQEPNPPNRPRKRLAESLQKLIHLLLLLDTLGRVIRPSGLPLGKRLPSETNHFFVAVR